MMPRHIMVFIYLTLLLLYSSSVRSVEEAVNDAAVSNTASRKSAVNERAEWSLGMGLGVFNYHLYPGAKESNSLLLPVPYFTYRSPKFEIDRGFKGFLYHSEKVVLDISADFGLPVDSDDTQARKGMPDLDFVLQVGPSIAFLLNDEYNNYFDTRFEIPVRVAYASDFHSAENIGLLIEPRFTFNHRRRGEMGLAQKATIGLKYATQEFHAYYYDVADAFTTNARAAFTSDAGFGGSFIKYQISYKTRDYIFWSFLRYQSLRGAKFEDSPLVLQKDYYFVGLGFAWLFAGSL
ncbi:MAG: MipA/OmpV family protein [Gammaproteobacteria bacterium]|nr:MipA/OmpV family protein [Gammaproteobacteria bacterium]